MKKRGIILLMICLCLIGCQTKEKSNITVYRLSRYYDWFLNADFYQNIIHYENEDVIDIDRKYGENIYIKGDDLFIEADEKQAQAFLEKNQQFMTEVIQQLNDLETSVNINEDYSQLTITMSQDFLQDIFSKKNFDYSGHLLGLMTMVNTQRIFITKDSDIPVDVQIINKQSGYQVSKAFFPYESLEMTTEDWQKSQSQNVETTSSKKGYSRILMKVVDKTENQIFFEPLDHQLYPDTKLCLCLDSVYSEDVYLPYQMNEQDTFYLELDGMYALHEDGDHIQDIAPLSIIPSQYLSEETLQKD